jgi:hypothetical protein
MHCICRNLLLCTLRAHKSAMPASRRQSRLISHPFPSFVLISFFPIPFIARQAFVVLSFNDPLSLNPTSHPSFSFPFPLSARTRRRRHTFLAKNYPSHPSVHPFVEVPLQAHLSPHSLSHACRSPRTRAAVPCTTPLTGFPFYFLRTTIFFFVLYQCTVLSVPRLPVVAFFFYFITPAD